MKPAASSETIVSKLGDGGRDVVRMGGRVSVTGPGGATGRGRDDAVDPIGPTMLADARSAAARLTDAVRPDERDLGHCRRSSQRSRYRPRTPERSHLAEDAPGWSVSTTMYMKLTPSGSRNVA
jgi:hypothetical protein